MSRHLGPEDKALEFFTTRQDPHTYSASAEGEERLFSEAPTRHHFQLQ